MKAMISGAAPSTMKFTSDKDGISIEVHTKIGVIAGSFDRKTKHASIELKPKEAPPPAETKGLESPNNSL